MQLAFPTSTALAAFPFKARHIGLDVYDREGELAYVCVSAGTGLAALAELTGGAGFTPAYYYGYDTGNLTWSATTWTAIHNVFAGLSNVDQVGISRSNSSFTITAAGQYLFEVRANAFNTTNSRYIGIRAQINSTTVGQNMVYTDNAARSSVPYLTKCITCAASDVVVIEYCLSGTLTGGAFVGATLNGEAGRTAAIQIVRVS